MSFLANHSTSIHVAVEVAIFAGVSWYFHNRIKMLQSEIDEVKEAFSKLIERNNEQDAAIRNIIGMMNPQRMVRPPPMHVPPQPHPQEHQHSHPPEEKKKEKKKHKKSRQPAVNPIAEGLAQTFGALFPGSPEHQFPPGPHVVFETQM